MAKKNSAIAKLIGDRVIEWVWCRDVNKLAWVLSQGDDIIPIPGTKRRKYLEQNAAAANITLTPGELKQLADAFPPSAVAGTRYPESQMHRVNV